jgi:flagellar biosynthetic protein FliR
MEPYLPFAYGFALVLFRTAGLVSVAPVMSARSVPNRVRLVISAALAMVAYCGAGTPQVALPPSMLSLAGAAAAETAVGLAGGFAARLLLDAASAAGHLAGLSMGMGFSAMLDPVNGTQSTTLAQLLSLLALGAAVALGIHREASIWLARSLIAVPPGGVVDFQSLLGNTVVQATYSCVLAVRVAFPILAAVTFGHLSLGLLGRFVTQLNLSSVGFSVAILAGGGALYLLAPQAAELAARSALTAFQRG